MEDLLAVTFQCWRKILKPLQNLLQETPGSLAKYAGKQLDCLKGLQRLFCAFENLTLMQIKGPIGDRIRDS